MSSEIVATRDGEISSLSAADDGPKDSNALGCEFTEDIRAFDALGLRSVWNPSVDVYLSDGNHHTRHFLTPEKGHAYITELSPTLEFVKQKLTLMKEPSVMLLRGCDQMFVQSDLPFEKFKTLTTLEISGVTNLTALPEITFSQMTQLRNLNLSHLPIQQLPHDFFSNLTNLRSLVLRGCSNLYHLPEIDELTALQSLDLSHLPIKTLAERFFHCLKNLHQVILRGCSKLRSLPSTEPLEDLVVLDLSHCTGLQELKFMHFCQPNLQMIDLSCTALHCTPTIDTGYEFTRLFLRDAKVAELKTLNSPNLQVLDLSGAHCVRDLDQLSQNFYLQSVDLSRTGIESIEVISELHYLRHIILRQCTRLVRLPEMEGQLVLELLDIRGCEILGDLPEDLSTLKRLKELNLSGCSRLRELRVGLFNQMSCLEKLDLSKTNINHLPSLSYLTNLRTLNISQTPVEGVPGLSNLVNLIEFYHADCHKLKGVSAAGLQPLTNLDVAPPRRGVIDFVGDHTSRPEGRISKLSEFHLVSTFFNDSAFDQFKQEFGGLVSLMIEIQENFKPTSTTDTLNSCTSNVDFGATTNIVSSETFKRHYGSMLTDLNYIRDSIDLLESSRRCTSAKQLLRDLLDATTHGHSAFDFLPGSTNLNKLLQTVAKLKLLIPPIHVDPLENNNGWKPNKYTYRSSKGDRDFRDRDDRVDMSWPIMQELGRSYDSLTDIQRNCLLYFSVFPPPYQSLSIKERILIQLWYGEGFIDPTYEETVALSNSDSTEKCLKLDPAACSNPNPEIMGTCTETSPTRSNANQVFTKEGVDVPNTIEEIARKVLMVLREKGFVDNKPIEDTVGIYWQMEEHVHFFLRVQAKVDRFFDFDQKNAKVTQHLTGSERACLLGSRVNFTSSCKLWLNYTSSSEKLERFKTVRTLFNVDDSAVDISAEWFSKMRNLCVLHLGRWNYYNVEHIEVVDLKFLEELKNMKQLRLLSLEGFSTMIKLPNSVCKLTNLKVLNLRGCGYLDELPADIGSLKSLTYLDLTDCHVISKLPKGVRLLSKLEVLKGFVITHQIGGRQHRDACTFKDLSELESLRTLKLVVNRNRFPDGKDLQAFKKMKNLCNLKITWEKNYDEDQETHDVVVQKEMRQYSRWKQLKCWEQQTRQEDLEEPLRSNHFDNLQKLVLHCFPLETAPDWLHPSELQKLEKLKILGGELKTLSGDTYENTWSVKTLYLKFLRNMKMDWEVLRCHFPHMTYLDAYESDLSSFPCVEGRVWTIGSEENKLSSE